MLWLRLLHSIQLLTVDGFLKVCTKSVDDDVKSGFRDFEDFDDPDVSGWDLGYFILFHVPHPHFVQIIVRDQHEQSSDRAFAPCLGGPGFDPWPSQTKDFKSVVEPPLFKIDILRVVRRKNWSTGCENNMIGRDIIRMCLQFDISVRQNYKVVIIPSVTSRHCPNMTRTVLKGTLNSIHKSGVLGLIDKKKFYYQCLQAGRL